MDESVDEIYTIENDPIVVMIFNLVKKHTGIDVEDLKTKSRKRPKVVARQLNMSFIERHTKYTLQAIADIFNRDHATVLHAKKTISDLIDTDKNIRILNELIEEEISKYKSRFKKTKHSVFKELLDECIFNPDVKKEWIEKFVSAE